MPDLTNGPVALSTLYTAALDGLRAGHANRHATFKGAYITGALVRRRVRLTLHYVETLSGVDSIDVTETKTLAGSLFTFKVYGTLKGCAVAMGFLLDSLGDTEA